MCCVSADESTPVAKPIGDQAARDPILLGNDLVVEIGSDAEDSPQTGVAVYRLEIVFVSAKVVVNEPRRAAVDGINVAAARRVERECAPGWLGFQTAEQGRRPNIGRLHATDLRVTL